MLAKLLAIVTARPTGLPRLAMPWLDGFAGRAIVMVVINVAMRRRILRRVRVVSLDFSHSSFSLYPDVQSTGCRTIFIQSDLPCNGVSA